MEQEDRLKTMAEEQGIELSSSQINSLMTHLDMVLKKNEVMNLTRIIDHDEAVVLHVLDSLLYLPLIDSEGRTLDVGTGAGFPGIPLALMSEGDYVLMDSVAKKVRACDEFITGLGLSERVTTTNMRAESYALEEGSSFDNVVARAVASIPVVMEYAQPLLKRDGALVVSRGKFSDEDFKEAESAASIMGFTLVERRSMELPHGLGHRELLKYEKTDKSKVRLPRKVGQAKHDPLY